MIMTPPMRFCFRPLRFNGKIRGLVSLLNIPFPPTEIQGVFFVAVMMDVIQRANPASMDPNSPSAGTQSWMFYNPEPNLEDLGSSPFILHMSESPFLGRLDDPCARRIWTNVYD